MKGNSIFEFAKNLMLKVQGLTRTQAIIAAVAGVVVVGGVGTGGYMAYAHSQDANEAIAEATEDTGIVEQTEELESVMDTEMIIAEIVEATETEEEEEVTQLSLVATSMERDLKIKIVNQNSKTVSGELFEVSVKPDKSGASATTYTDKDKDGIIYIDEIDAGKYVVELAEIEGYEIKKGSITVTVKEELEYEEVDITGEVKTESEINAAVEDTAVNNVPVESTLTDTVPLLESTVSATAVEKSQVDQSNFTVASASSEKISATLTKALESTESTETPDTEVPDTGTTETPSTGTTETPSTGTTETVTPTEMPSTGTEAVDSTQMASVSRNSVSRTATAANVATAVISLPKTVTLYNCDNTASTQYNLTLAVSGDASLIKSVEWTSSNTSLVAVSATKGNSITVSKCANAGNGTANIGALVTYYTDEKGNTSQTLIQTAVQVTNMTDTTTVLKDKSGNVLYKDSEAQTRAVLSDYHSCAKFYTEPKYTGWRTIDGKVYYFGADNKSVTGSQVIGGVTYTFSSDGSLAQSSGVRGIDVSKWQGKIDWGAVSASGISFAIIRVGYRGATTGALVEDPYFRQNIAGATRAGIKVGVYFFTQAVNEAEAVEEASMAIAAVSGYNLSFPIFIDTENASNGRANGLDVGTRTAVVNAFCKTVANAGYRPGIYASKSWYNNKLNMSVLNNYYIWVAQYNSTCTYSGKYNMWQYTSKGSVPGINGNVDMNICY